MTKKIKKNKKGVKPATAPQPVAKAVAAAVKHPKPTFELIRFDSKTYTFLFILIFAYLLLSSLRIHTSNIGNWDLYWGKKESESVIAGKPRFIRMDEWMVSTPGVLSQYQLGMPVKNVGLGAEKTPVVMGMPVKDMSALLRPFIWPYFIFDEERAFAFSWNFNIFFCLISTFLLFMLLTRNQFWLSVFGALFIFFSSGVQWWSYHIGYQMMYLNGMLISVLYILYHKKWVPLVISAFVLLCSISSFLFMLYPAFQVPLIYLYLALFIGFLWQRKSFKTIAEKFSLRLAVASATAIVLGLFLFHYYHLVKDSYTAMMNTVYPGKRFSTGGDLVSGKFFADFFGMFMTDTHVPKLWLNICEASGFIMVFPIIFYAMGYHYFKSRKMDPLLLSLSVFVIIGSLYVLLGFPAFLSKITLLSMSPSFRALPILGAGNAFLLVCFLGSKSTGQATSRFSWLELGIVAISIVVFIRIISMHINKVTGNFFTAEQINIVTLLVSIVYLTTRYKDYRWSKPVLYLAIGIMLYSNLLANPVTVGLSAVRENPLVKASKEIWVKNPEARWAVWGKEGWDDARLGQLLVTNGIPLFNGVKFIPPVKDMRQLDPSGQYDSVYNRYAWISMRTYIAGNDSVVFRQSHNDGYVIFSDPCSARLKQLRVKYNIFLYKPQEVEVRCMTRVEEISNLYIYKRNDE